MGATVAENLARRRGTLHLASMAAHRRLGGSVLVCAALAAAGCLDLSKVLGGDAGDAGSGSSSGGTAAGDAGTTTSGTHGAQSGTNCATDPTSGITLCEAIDACPGLTVDQGAFPGCGWRMNAASLYDLECGCGDALCPIGTPTSCADAAQLLDQEQSSVIVCQQLSEGSCLPLAPASSGGTSTCDKSCESQCAGDPSCIQMCGC
jgi:hypothetical protein